MDESFYILLLLLIVGHLLITPLVLIGIVRAHRRRLRQLEAAYEQLERRLARPPQGPVEATTTEAESSPVPPLATVEPISADAPHREAAPVGPNRVVVLRDFLRGVGMWPPEGRGGDRETVLMQWWLPRVGGVLALLSALFFGAYINQSTSALFKCVELLVASLAIAGLGRFMERRYRTFGGVLLVTGLIMLYLTSVAAYVLPATRVIGNPIAGSFVQAGVLAGICVVGLLRRSPGIVMLAFSFGYFLCVFMAWEGLREGALIAAALLLGAGAAMGRKDLFQDLPWFWIPGTFIVALAFPVMGLVRVVEIPRGISMQVFINITLAAVAGLYLAGKIGRGVKYGRILLSIASSLSILATGLFFRSFEPDTLEWASLILGLNMLGFSILAWGLRGCGFAAQLLFIKASFLVAVWAVLYFAGDLRWMVLGLQTLVVSIAARRARELAMEVAVWAVAVASYILYSAALLSVPGIYSFTWWMMVLYPGVIVLAFACLLPPFDTRVFSFRDVSRKHLYWLVPALAFGLWFQLFSNTSQRDFPLSVPFLILAYIGGGLALIPFLSRWVVLLTAALGFTAASVLYCTAPFSLMLLVFLAAAGLSTMYTVVRMEGTPAEVVENALYVLIRVPAILWLLQALDDWPGQGALMILICICMVVSGLIPRLRHSAGWAFLPLLVLVISERGWISTGPWMPVALALGLVWLVLPVLWPRLVPGLGWIATMQIWGIVWAFLLWLYATQHGDPESTWLSGQVLFSVVAILLFVAAWRWPVPGYLVGGLLFSLVVVLRHFLSALGEAGAHVPWVSEVLFSAVFLYAIALLWFYLKPAAFGLLPEAKRPDVLNLWSGLSAGLLYLVSVVTFIYEPLGMRQWYTPVLAVTAFVMIFLGLFRLDVVYRRMGLLALAVPLVRLFVVDVKDALHRIIAFAAAAVLLTVLGYLYHRLASRLRTD